MLIAVKLSLKPSAAKVQDLFASGVNNKASASFYLSSHRPVPLPRALTAQSGLAAPLRGAFSRLNRRIRGIGEGFSRDDRKAASRDDLTAGLNIGAGQAHH